jgi:hypothetical protein
MRRLLTMALPLALLATTSGLAAADGAPAKLLIGKPAPMRDTPMKSVDGKELTIAQAAGKKGTMVIFICNHCPWVKMWQSRIAAIGNAAMEKGLGVIAINSNDPEAYPEDGFDQMKERAEQVGYKFPYAVDATSEVARAFGASHTPEAYVFDAKGRLVYHGGVDDNARDEAAVKSAWLKDAVDAVASGHKVAMAETKALGCGIKLRGKGTES